MRHIKWIFIVSAILLLTSFIGKDKPTGGLNVGDIAPNFTIPSTSNQSTDLRSLRGKYVLINFWASYDAPSRLNNASFAQALRNESAHGIALVSVSFDEYPSIFRETIRKDQVGTSTCFVDTAGHQSPLYKQYRLHRGFSNYLLNADGVIVAKNISPEELVANYNTNTLTH